MAEPGVATAPEAAVDEVVATARQALLGAPPLGAPEYLRFAEAVSAGAGRRWAEVEEANAQDLEDGRARGLSGPFLDRIRLDERHLELFRALGRSIARELPELVRPGSVVTGLGGLQAVEPTPGRMLRFVPVPRQRPIDRGALRPDIERLTDTEQYQLWLERHGPTPEVLSSVRFALH